ncbi:MAG: DivIVA domain-containing protein, partial [Ruminococcus sp.]|nr:DivIVA domain-containing protein [Ruminococcus sp.]
MMVPNQIKNFNFQPAGRGTYKASEVDNFKQKVYTAYSEVFSENSALKSKFTSLANLVEEYNEGKNAIATTMIKAQTFADETIKDATAKAEKIVADANAEAEQAFNQKKVETDAYVAEKTAEADSYHSRAQSELDVVLQKAAKEAEAYIVSVNEKAASIIANANEQASKIVSAAYVDAQKARTTCDDILEQANAKLAAMKAEVAEFRKETKRLLSIITPVVDDIDVPDDLPSFGPSENTFEEKADEAVLAESEIEPFKFDPYAVT